MLSLNRGQSLEDKLYAVKYFISGQGLCYVVLKATTSEVMGCKKKHLNYLINVTNEPNVSIPNLVRYLLTRARRPEWSVVFKSLLTTHHLMNYGNERFIQNLASSVVYLRTFDKLSNFTDRSSSLAYEMSTFLRRYSRYVCTKIKTYQCLGFEFCRATTNSEQVKYNYKSVDIHQLDKILGILQSQFDSLLAFDATTKVLNNGVINSVFSMLYKDFVKLYINYQSAIIRLLELYFSTSDHRGLSILLDRYKKFLIDMDKTSDLMRVVHMLAMDTRDMPTLSRCPSLPLSSLERQLESVRANYKQRKTDFYQQLENYLQKPAESESVVEPPPRIDYGILERRRNSQGEGRSFSRSSSSIVRNRKRPNEINGSTVAIGTKDKRRECDSSSLSIVATATTKEYKHLSGGGGAQEPNVLLSIVNVDSTTTTTTTSSLLLEEEVKEEEPDLMVLDEEPESCQEKQQELSKGVLQKHSQPVSIAKTPLDWVQVEL